LPVSCKQIRTVVLHSSHSISGPFHNFFLFFFWRWLRYLQCPANDSKQSSSPPPLPLCIPVSYFIPGHLQPIYFFPLSDHNSATCCILIWIERGVNLVTSTQNNCCLLKEFMQ